MTTARRGGGCASRPEDAASWRCSASRTWKRSGWPDEPDRVRAVLGGSGFASIELEAVEEPMVFGAGVDDAYRFVATMGIVEWLTADLAEAARAEALEQLRAAVEAHEQPTGVAFGSSAWLITARQAQP